MGVCLCMHQYVCVCKKDRLRKTERKEERKKEGVFLLCRENFNRTYYQSVSEIFKSCSFISNMNVSCVSVAISVKLHLN